MYEKLPQELKERGAFCLWKYEERDGSRTKVPYQTNGVLLDMAKDIITRMNTYTEYSPSGTGVRILFKASLPAYDKDRYYINNRRIKLEVYVAGYTSRFVTVTGNARHGKVVLHYSSAEDLDRIYEFLRIRED